MIIYNLNYWEDISVETSPIIGGNENFTGLNITVKNGQTLSGITSRFYADGTPSCYEPIAEINGIPDPNQIQVGQPLELPLYVRGCGYLCGAPQSSC